MVGDAPMEWPRSCIRTLVSDRIQPFRPPRTDDQIRALLRFREDVHNEGNQVFLQVAKRELFFARRSGRPRLA